MVVKFDKVIKDIHENNEFFEIDYQDLLDNFDSNNESDEKEKLTMQLSIINIAFIDSVRGPISRPKYIDRILSIFRKEMIEDIRYRLESENDKDKDKDKSSQNNI